MDQNTLRREGLSETALKAIALGLMVLDHIHYFFLFTGAVPDWFSMLGRLSAPLFLFCAAEGFAHTHDRRAYLGRLWAMGAGMGLVQFLLALFGRRADGFYPMNAILRDLTVSCLLWGGCAVARGYPLADAGAALERAAGLPAQLDGAAQLGVQHRRRLALHFGRCAAVWTAGQPETPGSRLGGLGAVQ